jgi:hypothetical protein
MLRAYHARLGLVNALRWPAELTLGAAETMMASANHQERRE